MLQLLAHDPASQKFFAKEALSFPTAAREQTIPTAVVNGLLQDCPGCSQSSPQRLITGWRLRRENGWIVGALGRTSAPQARGAHSTESSGPCHLLSFAWDFFEPARTHVWKDRPCHPLCLTGHHHQTIQMLQLRWVILTSSTASPSQCWA